jgi:hypothetical protein
MSERKKQRRGATRRAVSLLPILLGMGWLVLPLGLAGCPDDPYKAETWTKKLGEPRETERAVTELEQLGDPSAIDKLGSTWVDQGKPGRLLQVIISLARPLTPEEAKAKFATDYEKAGRPASWGRALPFLNRALTEVDETNDRSVDSAMKAADALGESRLPDGLDALIELAHKPMTKRLIKAQVAAIRAIGKYKQESAKAAAALIKLIDKEPPPTARTAKDKEQARAVDEKYALFLGIAGAAINALGDLHTPQAAKPLVLAMYRMPELFPRQIRRALVATGPAASDELRKVLAGSHAEVNQLFHDKRLDKYCGDRNDAPLDQCQPVSAMYFYPAVVLGDFYDAKAVPELLEALKHPPLPVYYIDDQPSAQTQYHAIFDALRKIGSPEGAQMVRAMGMGHAVAEAPRQARGGRKGAAAQAGGELDITTRVLAIGAYPFLARDDAGADELAKIAADNKADDRLRQEASTSFARLSHDPKDIAVLEGLAQKYFEASAKRRAEADGKPKATSTTADREFEKAKKVRDDAKTALVKTTHDNAKTAEDIKTATDAAKKAEDAFKVAQKSHKDAVAPYKSADAAAKTYKGYARMFQTHIARIEIAIRCKQDINCYAASLKLTPEEAAKNNAPYIRDIKSWTKDEQLGLVEANVERAMLEIGKRGQKAQALTDTLLDSAKSDDRLIRQSVLLALPKIARVPCTTCEAKLDAAIKAGEGKTTLDDLNLETTMMKNYFGWAGGNTPSKAADNDAAAPAAPAAPPSKKAK